MKIPVELARLGKVHVENSARYSDSVHVEQHEDGSSRIVVTDGKILLLADVAQPPNDRDVPAWDANVRSKLWRMMKNLTPRGGSFEVIPEDNQVVLKTVRMPGHSSLHSLSGDKADGKFPDYAQLLPAFDKPLVNEKENAGKYLRGAMSVSVLAGLCEVLGELGMDVVNFEVPVQTGVKSETEPIRFTCHSSGESPTWTLRGLVMPAS